MTTAKKTFDPWPAATVTAVADILTNTDDGLSDREIDLLLERMEIADVDGPNDGPPPSRCGPVRRHSSSRRAVLLTVRGRTAGGSELGAWPPGSGERIV
ncbi:hypothetical protein ACH4E9_34770 [Streptomyces anulatus]